MLFADDVSKDLFEDLPQNVPSNPGSKFPSKPRILEDMIGDFFFFKFLCVMIQILLLLITQHFHNDLISPIALPIEISRYLVAVNDLNGEILPDKVRYGRFSTSNSTSET